MTELCLWCEVNAGRVKKGRPCCELRELAGAPPQVIAARKKSMTESEWELFRPVLAVEWARIKAIRKANGRPEPGLQAA